MLPLWAQPQPPAAAVSFDVASIKALPRRPGFPFTNPNPHQPIPEVSGNRFHWKPTTFAAVMVEAYNVRSDQIFDLPKWASMDGDFWEFDARALGNQPLTTDRAREMLQALLADRFQLKIHRETRNLPTYLLTLGKNAPKLKELPAGTRHSLTTMSLAAIVAQIDSYLDHPVVDRTGLPASIYELHWDLGEAMKEVPKAGFFDQRTLAPSIFQIVRDDVGLKLDLVNQPTEVLVVDSVEKASVN
jgi:uncharacterized protein (TIGR03435 family)